MVVARALLVAEPAALARCGTQGRARPAAAVQHRVLAPRPPRAAPRASPRWRRRRTPGPARTGPRRPRLGAQRGRAPGPLSAACRSTAGASQHSRVVGQQRRVAVAAPLAAPPAGRRAVRPGAAAEIAASTAIRTSSCRNRRPVPSVARIPESRQACMAGPGSGMSVASRPASTRGAEHRGRLDRLPGRSPARASRAATASRTVGGTDGQPGSSTSIDVERVAAGDPVQLGGVHLARARQRPDRAGGQRRQLHPPGAALRGQVAEDQPERVIVGDLVVPVGGHHQGRARLSRRPR